MRNAPEDVPEHATDTPGRGRDRAPRRNTGARVGHRLTVAVALACTALGASAQAARAQAPAGPTPTPAGRATAPTQAAELARARDAIAAGRPDAALRIYEQQARRHPRDGELAALVRRTRALVQLHQAEQALQRGDAAEALRLAEPLVAGGPDPYRAGLSAARALQGLHREDDAARLYRELSHRFPRDADLLRQARQLEAAQALDRADAAMRAGDAIAAVRLAQPVYESGVADYRAGWLLVRALLANHWKPRALTVLESLARAYPADAEIARQLRSLRAELQLDAADTALRAGDTERAIALAQPVYEAGDDPYRAGWLLGRALVRAGRTARAEAVFAELARRYPADPELALQPVLLLARMHDAPRAHDAFVALPQAGRTLALQELGDAARWVYPNSLSAGLTRASSSGAMPGDDDAWLLYSHTGSQGTLALGLERAHRFGQEAHAASIDLYRGLGDGYGLQLGIGASPEQSFLASRSVTAGLTRDFSGLSVESSVRWLEFGNSQATVLYGGVSWQATGPLRVRAGLYLSPTHGTYSVLLAPSWRDPWGHAFASLSAGNEADQIGVQGALQRIPSYTLRVGHSWALRPDLALGADVFREHRSGLYERSGIELSLTRRW